MSTHLDRLAIGGYVLLVCGFLGLATYHLGWAAAGIPLAVAVAYLVGWAVNG